MKKSTLLAPIILSITFPLLLHKQQAGINVFILDLIIIGMAFLLYRSVFKKSLVLLMTAGVLISSVMIIIHGSTAALVINILSLIIFSGVLAAPHISILFNSFIALVAGSVLSPFHFLKTVGGLFNSIPRVSTGLRYVGYVVLPLLFGMVFISIYSAASPYYNSITANILTYFVEFFRSVFENINLEIALIALCGFISGVIIYFSKMPLFIELPGEKGDLKLSREKRWFNGSKLALRNELHLGVIMFAFLNLIIGVMNALDIWYVWIDFQWDGGFLKQFVHEGTWLLILSIGISILIVLWYFRGNLNFFSKNNNLKLLANIWIAQNAFLALSVGVRNIWYLSYFNLAFKRIWVFAFLILVLFGLYTVFIKVNKLKTFRYLLIYNSLAIYVVFLSLSFFNWDNIIAKFNLRRADKAFFHTNFMVTLDSSTLPYLIIGNDRLNEISEAQAGMFTYHSNYMSLKKYNSLLVERKKLFIDGYKQLHWLSWTVSDYITYKKLNAVKSDNK